MNKIGKTIADLRKANNMTQSEVADILGVSYQAVSKWERDESLPDITLLPQIADLYHISIDQLLRGSFEMKEEEVEQAKEIVEEATQDDTEEAADKSRYTFDSDNFTENLTNYINKELNDAFTNAFESLAPFMKPKKIHKVLNKRKIKLGSFSKSAYEYLDSDTINDMIDSIEEVDEDTYDQLMEIVPMCNAENRDRILDLIMEGDMSKLDISEILPFLNKAQINRLLEGYLESADREEAAERIEDFMPFINHEGKDRIVDYLIEGDLDDVNIEDYLPFLNSPQKDRIVSWITQQKDPVNIEEILPFLNRTQKRALLTWAVEHMDLEDLTECAPFMEEEMISEYVKRYVEEERDDDLSEMYVFMDQDTKKLLIKYYLDHQMNDELIELLSFMK